MNGKVLTVCFVIVIVALGVFALGAFWDRYPSRQEQQPSSIFPARSSAQVSAAIENVLDGSDIIFTSSDSLQEYSHSASSEPAIRWSKRDYRVSLHDRSRLPPLIQRLSHAMTVHGGEIFQTHIEPENHQARIVVGIGTFITHHLVFTWTPPVLEEVPPASNEKPDTQFRAAIVIDDLGTNLMTVRRLLDLQADFTFSVLPHLEKSTEVARLLHDYHREVFLHLPMEPLRYPDQYPGTGAVMTNMGTGQIQQLIDRDLQTVPFASGVNNHMGSRLTSDWNAMKIVLEHLDNRQLGFMDSRTTDRSIAYKLAQQLGVKSAQRKIFLDNEANVPAVKAQLEKLAALAEQGGPPAIAIGHPKEATLQALQDMLPEFERRNIQIVRVSTFMK